MTVAETLPFLRQAARLWDEEEHTAFIDYIARNPDSGDVIPDSGGIRRLRWRRPGTGKRGGVRVIYFYHDEHMPLYLLQLYTKAQQEDWIPAEKRQARDLVATLKQLYRRH